MRLPIKLLRLENLDPRICFAFGDLDTSFGLNGALDYSYESNEANFEYMRGLFEFEGNVRTLATYADGSNYAISSVDSTGQYQTGFGDGGIVRIHNRLLGSVFNSVHQLSDGKIRALENIGNPTQGYVVQLLPDGNPDPAFGDNGIVLVNHTMLSERDLFTLPSGDFLLFQPNPFGGSGFVSKYNSLGQLDNSFGQGGTAAYPQMSRISQPFLDGQHRICFAGMRYEPTLGVSRFTLVRLLPNGDLDTSLNGSGFLSVDSNMFGGNFVAADSKEWQYTDVTYKTNPSTNTVDSVQFRRLQQDGALDMNFGDQGIADITIPTNFRDGLLNANLLMVDEFGQAYLTLVGRPFSTTSNIIVCRINPDGTLDTNYGQNGWFFQTLNAAVQLHNGLFLKSGKLVVAGEDFITNDQFLLQIDSEGKVDIGFSQDGLALLNLDNGYRDIRRMRVLKQPSQELAVLSGWYPQQNYLGRGVHLDSFGNKLDEYPFVAAGNQTTLVSNPLGGWFEIYRDENSGIEGEAWVRKFNQVGQLDITFGNSGRFKLISSAIDYYSRYGGVANQDGSLYVFASAGPSSTINDGEKSAILVKFAANGQLDLVFGQQGEVAFTDPKIRIVSMAANLQRGVYLVSTGRPTPTTSGFEIVSLDGSGRLISAFGAGGIASVISNYVPVNGAIAVDERGGVFIAASRTGQFRLLAFNSHGQTSINFGSGGQVALPIENRRSYGSLSLAAQRGLIAVWGTQSGLRSSSGRLIALDYSGNLDTRLSGSGFSDYNFSSMFASSNEILFADDGSLYVTLDYEVGDDQIGSLMKIDGTGDVWIHNWQTPLDVNKSSNISPSDALVVINYLNSRQGNEIPGLFDGVNFPDVNDDLLVTPADALLVIDYLNQKTQGEGENQTEDRSTDAYFADLIVGETEGSLIRKRSSWPAVRKAISGRSPR